MVRGFVRKVASNSIERTGDGLRQLRQAEEGSLLWKMLVLRYEPSLPCHER